MSWRARMSDETKYLPQHPAVKNKTPSSFKKTNGRSKPKKGAEIIEQPKPNYSTTTMTGFPWSVRDKLEGKLKVKPPQKDAPARLANYTFTYGLSEEDEKQLRSEAESTFGTSKTSSLWVNKVEPERHLTPVPSRQPSKFTTNNPISERLKEIKQSFQKAELFPQSDQPVPYFQDWGSRETSSIAGGVAEVSPMDELFHSTRKIMNQAGLHEGLVYYFEGLDEMDCLDEKDKDPFRLSPTELAEAVAAFQPPTPKPSRLQRKTISQLRPATNTVSRDETANVSQTSAFSVVPFGFHKSTKGQMNDIDPTVFIKPPPLHTSHREKIIDRQLQREVASTPMTYEQYSSRKKELMDAALQTYDPAVPTYEAMLDIRDEAIAAEEAKKAASRANVMDLLYNALTNQSASVYMKSPSTSLHLSHAHMAERQRVDTSRPLDQFNGAVVSTILRELQETKVDGAVSSRRFTPITSTNVSKHVQNKDKLKALRALENYDLTKLRERTFVGPKTVLTLLSAKNTPAVMSSYSRVGGTGLVRDKYNYINATRPGALSKERDLSSEQRQESINTIASRRGSVTALSVKTRNEKYSDVKSRSAPGTTVEGHHKEAGNRGVIKDTTILSHRRYRKF